MTTTDILGFLSIVALAFVVGAIFGMLAARRCLINRKWNAPLQTASGVRAGLQSVPWLDTVPDEADYFFVHLRRTWQAFRIRKQNNSLTVSPDAKREANTSGGIGSP